MASYREWTPSDASEWIAVPPATADKYSRGVLGVVTGSARYPGAAVIGVDAALHTGVGMVRYLGPESVAARVLDHRPEAVAVAGHVQAWLLGSGMETGTRQLADALADGYPAVLDAGAIPLVSAAAGPTVITPHAGELATLLGIDRDAVASGAGRAASVAAHRFGVTVLLKGHTTHVVAPNGAHFGVTAPTTWLATAGTGDALAGILGSLVATHADVVTADPDALAKLAVTAAFLHGQAGARAGGGDATRPGGPFTVLDLNTRLPEVIAELCSRA